MTSPSLRPASSPTGPGTGRVTATPAGYGGGR
jgi:hypothetical protein